jgi:hypothetical protein
MGNRRPITEITTKTTSESITIKSKNQNSRRFVANAPIEENTQTYFASPVEVRAPLSKHLSDGEVKPNQTIEFDYSEFDDKQIQAIHNWFIYRKEVKKPYKSKSSLTALRNKMLELKASGLLIEAINHSIAMEYTGLFPPSQSSSYGGHKKPSFNYIHNFTLNKPINQVDTF